MSDAGRATFNNKASFNSAIAVGQSTFSGGSILADFHGSGSGVGAQLAFANDHNTDKFYVGLEGNTTGDAFLYQQKDADINFYTNNTYRAKLDNSGNFLIGRSSSTSAKLHLEQATSVHMDMNSTGDNRGKIGSKVNDLYIGHSSSAANIYFKNNISSDGHPADSGDTKMVIADAGVGIGTTSVTSGVKLDVQGGNIMAGGFNSGTEYGLILTPSNTSTYWNIANITGGNLTFNHSATIGSSEKMRLDSNGQLGIGGTPAYLLDVEGAAQFNNIVPTYQNGNGTSSSSNVWKLGTITINGSTGAVITVLGTQSYSAGAQVAGKTEIVLRGQNATTTLEGYFYGNTLGANTVTNVYWKNTGTSNEFEIWIKYGANFAGLDHFVETAGTWVSAVSDTGSTSAPAGSTGLPSQFVVNTGGSPRIRVDNDGLKFGSDTAAANALDDYEEGTWTPSNASVTLTNVTGTYVKIGKLVYAAAQVTYPTNTNANVATINGLPFTVENNDASFQGTVGLTNFNDDNLYFGSETNSTNVLVRNAGNGNRTCQDLSGKFVNFMVIYRAA